MKKFLIALCFSFILLGLVFGSFSDTITNSPPFPSPSSVYKFWEKDGVGYFILSGAIYSEFDNLLNAIAFFDSRDVKKIVIFLNSPGGSVFDGLAFAQLLLEQQRKGKIVETRCYGLAASAATFVLASGTIGYRYIAKHSFVMIHELMVVKFFETQNVSQVEKEAEAMRKIQDATIRLLASRTKLSVEELRKRCKEETWITAEDAIALGFADHLIER